MIIDFVAGRVLFLLFVLVCALEDWRYKGISSDRFIWAYGGEAFFYLYRTAGGTQPDYGQILTGLAFGAILLAVARLSGEAIGSGDGHFFMATGLAAGGGRAFFIFLTALVFVSLAALSRFARVFSGGHSIRHQTMALVPFAIPASIYLVAEMEGL